MLYSGSIESLSDADHIGVMGDLHGNLSHTAAALKTLARRHVHAVVETGDWSYIFGGAHNWQVDVDKLSRKLSNNVQTMYFVDGNHEDFPRLLRFPVGPDGLRWIRPNIAHMPRGWRTRIGDKYALAALGGANSIDFDYRTRGVDWWDEEQITEADLNALGTERADVLVGHEAPLRVPTLDRHLQTLSRWPIAAEWYARDSRSAFHRAVMQTRPQLTLGGHYHHWVDDKVTYTDHRGSFDCRVVVLDRDGPGVSLAVLDSRTLDLTFLHRDGTEAGRRHNEGGVSD